MCYYVPYMDSKTLQHRRTRRTTLTLEADVADYLAHKLSSDKKLKEKRLINDLLRKAIELDDSDERPDFYIEPFKTRLAPGITKAKLEELIDEI